MVFDGSLPGFLTGVKPAPMRSATAAPKMNPRLSMPTTTSMPWFSNGSARLSIAARNPAGSCSSVVMS